MKTTITKCGLAAVMLLGALASAPVAAQAQRQAVQAQAASATQLSPQLQRQIEAEGARRANPNCGANCTPAAGSRLVAPGGGGGGLGYVCNDGSCACAGACDCQVMGDICVPKTIGCNDYGCTCEETEGAEHPESTGCDG